MTANDARERVLGAALELIARDGFDGVRMADIAERAQVSRALVHYHFSNRAELLTQALAHSLSAAEARLERAAADARRSTPPQRLADLIDFALPVSRADIVELRLWSELEFRAAGSPELARALSDLNARVGQPLADAVADGLAQGDFHRGEPHEVAVVAQALLAGLSVRLSTHDPQLTLAQARQLAGRHLALAVGYPGELPFQPLPLPEPGGDGTDAPAQPHPTRRRRAPRAGARP